MKYGLLVFAVLGLMSYVFYNSYLPVLILFAPALFLFLKQEKKSLMVRRKERFKKQFLTAGSLLGNHLKSGESIENAMSNSRRELLDIYGERSDIVNEWKMMENDLELNTPMEEAIGHLAKRVHIEEIDLFAELFSLVNRKGGQVGEVISTICRTLEESFSTEEQIETLVTAKKFEQKIMDVIPIVMILYLRGSSPDLLAMLYETSVGRVVMTFCLLLYIGSVVWAEKIITIHV